MGKGYIGAWQKGKESWSGMNMMVVEGREISEQVVLNANDERLLFKIALSHDHDDVVVNMVLRLVLTHVNFIETRGSVSLP